MSSLGGDGVVRTDFSVLEPPDLAVLEGKSGATALGFAVLLKYFRCSEV